MDEVKPEAAEALRIQVELVGVAVGRHLGLDVRLDVSLADEGETEAARRVQERWPVLWAALAEADGGNGTTRLSTRAALVDGLVDVVVRGAEDAEEPLATLKGATFGAMRGSVQAVQDDVAITRVWFRIKATVLPPSEDLGDLVASAAGPAWLEITQAEPTVPVEAVEAPPPVDDRQTDLLDLLGRVKGAAERFGGAASVTVGGATMEVRP